MTTHFAVTKVVEILDHFGDGKKDVILGTWVPGFLGSWVPGVLGSWVPGFLGSWVPGFLGS